MKKILLVVFTLFCFVSVIAQSENVRSESKVVIDGTYYYVHTVKPGETISSISRLYDIDQKTIINNNPHIDDILRVGEALKIPIKNAMSSSKSLSSKKLMTHTVNAGETTYSIAKRYGISVENLIDANKNFDPLHISIGQNITIPRQMIGTASEDEVKVGFDKYNEALSSVTPDFKLHLVEAKETLYSISKKYGVEISAIEKNNVDGLKDGLKYGSVIKIPVTAKKQDSLGAERIVFPAKQESVKQEDSNQLSPEQGFYPKYIDKSKPIDMVIMLPFKTGSTEESNFVDFYDGALLALEDLKRDGISVNVSVFNSGRSEAEVQNLIDNGSLKNADLVIGPVYNEAFTPVAEFARSKGIPIVSPLAPTTIDTPNVYQVAPNPDKKYEKLKEYMTGEYNIIVIKPETDLNQEFYQEISAILPKDVKTINNYSKTGTTSGILDKALIFEKENVLVIATDNQNITDQIMTRVSSIQNRVSASGGRGYKIHTIGTSRWAKFQNFDHQLFFKLGVMYITTYYADRSDKNVLKFDSEYINVFSTLPSYYSYRGYDITKIFVSAVHKNGDGYMQAVGKDQTGLLQVKYDFEQQGNGKWVNNEWVLVSYHDDFTIDVK